MKTTNTRVSVQLYFESLFAVILTFCLDRPSLAFSCNSGVSAIKRLYCDLNNSGLYKSSDGTFRVSANPTRCSLQCAFFILAILHKVSSGLAQSEKGEYVNQLICKQLQ